jgi:hypothetical protein
VVAEVAVRTGAAESPVPATRAVAEEGDRAVARWMKESPRCVVCSSTDAVHRPMLRLRGASNMAGSANQFRAISPGI